jgi:hypothetical protein
LQDRVALSVSGVIEPTLQATETARRAGYPTTDLTAYDLYLRAYAMVWSSAARIPEALRLMEQGLIAIRYMEPRLASRHCAITDWSSTAEAMTRRPIG